jgi:hypothetical protein
MTQPPETPGTLFYLLALYAELDRAVLESENPDITATVEGFLPGTTGEDQRGWSRDLQNFLGREFPDVDAALSAIASAPPLTRPQLSRLVYVLGSLLQLPGPRGRTALDDELFVQGLSLAQPQSAPSPGPAPIVTYVRGGVDPGRELLGVLGERFNKRQDWNAAIAYAVRIGCLDQVVASVPLCNACLATQGGIECVVVDTRFEDGSISINQVKAILDPRNWDKTAGEFFCNMQYLGPGVAPYLGWGRVLETVSAWCGSGLPVLHTDLVFLKEDDPGQAVVQYDLDIPFPGAGDGQVTVDKGWLKVVTGTSTNSNAGVTVTTRKVVHIDPLSPVAQKVFVCVMGYGQAAMEMLLGGAINPPPNPVPWSDPPAPLVVAQSAQVASAPAGNGGNAPPTTAAGLAVSMLSDYLAEVSNDSAEIVAKCADKELTVEDLAKFSAKLGARMASEPWRFLQKLSELPPRTPSGGPTQGGDNA